MNQFNTPPSPAHWLPDQKRKPGKIDARAHIRAAITTQRTRWANQIKPPPIPGSRAGHGWELWEHQFVLENQDKLSLKHLAQWTGRTAGEILAYLENEDS